MDDRTALEILIDFEIEMVNRLGWSLHTIDETNTESLFDFMDRLNGRGKPTGSQIKRVYCDQVTGL